jgi:hypothetical protein
VRYGTRILAPRACDIPVHARPGSARNARRRAAPWVRAAIVVPGVAVVVAACGSSTSTMGTTKVAQAIQATILSHNGVHTTVSCPKRVTVRSGYRFTCSAALAVGAYPMHVVENNSHGAVSYSNLTPLRVLDSYTIERAIESAIRHQRHLKSKVECPKPILQTAALSFTCTATLRDGSNVFGVTETDSYGHVTFVGR